MVRKITPPNSKGLKPAKRQTRKTQSAGLKRFVRGQKSSSRSSRPLPSPISTQETHWTKEIRPRMGGTPLAFSLTITPSNFKKLFATTAPETALREGSFLPAASLLLFDTFALGDREIDVEIWVQRTEDPSKIQIKVALTSPTALPSHLHVTLQWNDYQTSIPIQNGQAAFTDIPIHDLEDTGKLQIQFVIDEPNSPVSSLYGSDR